MENYLKLYKKKLTTAEKAVSRIRNNETVVCGVNFSEPPVLLSALADRARQGDLKKISTYSFNPSKHMAETIFAPDLCDVITPYAWFVSAPIRNMVKVGLAYYIPSYFYQVPRFIRDCIYVDTLITSVSPMDKGGYFSFGAASYLRTAANKAKKIIVEVNENIPRVFGDCQIHISEVDLLIESDATILETPPPGLKDENKTIGRIVAEIVPDGATIQLGIGGLPNAVAACFANHKDLGIHSELLGPGMVHLIREGVITGRRKTLHPRKHVFAVAYGNKDVFEFIDDNSSMESYSSEYIMKPEIIATNDRMVSINSIIEVDLTGQCNAESIGGTQFSGTGGQLDFVRGAYASKGGMSILAFYSTAKNGTISKVVPRLSEGAVVTTPRMDVNYLATEYGIVNLKGKSSKQRVLDLVSIAHPSFREDLMKEADEMRLL